MKSIALCIAFLLPMLGLSEDDGALSPIVEIHGSGASNPSRCYWNILEEMESQTKITTRMTYRATSSGDGQSDFVGNVTLPYSDFASGDYPMRQERYQTLKDEGIEMIHLPVLLGAVGVFHSVPVKDGHTLNMTSCLIAKVFLYEITDWNHEEIAAINPNLDIPVKLDNYGHKAEDQSFAIVVARDLLGSSSHFAFTQYLHKTCPESWPADMVGSGGTLGDAAKVCPGSSFMVECVREEVGVVGYTDAGLGHDEGLAEAALKISSNNLEFRHNDFYLTSENSMSKGGLLPVLDEETSLIPTRADADWSGVDLINQVEGYVYSWPMVSMTYVYIRKDLPSVIPDPRAQTLLIAFLRALYDDTYADVCETRFKFVRVQGNLKEIALAGIEMLETSPGAPEWTKEADVVLSKAGQGNYVISTRRQRSSVIEQEILIHNVEQTYADVQTLQDDVTALQRAADQNTTRNDLDQLLEDLVGSEFGDDERRRLDVTFALTMSALVLWVCLLVFTCNLKSQVDALKGGAQGMAQGETSRKKARSMVA